MATTATSTPVVSNHLPASALISDTITLAWRCMIRFLRTPQLVIAGTTSPVLFLLLFYYVFGGAIPIRGLTYVDYLVPAFFVQNVLFAGFTTAVAIAEDARSGLVDRFRSLPIARAAPLLGRALFDVLNQGFVLALTTGVAMLLGFRFQTGLLPALAAVGLTLLLALTFFWVFAAIGLLTRSPETTQAMTTPFFLLIFISSAYIPVSTMPVWLQRFANYQPVSVFTNALRCLTQGAPAEAILQHTTSYYVEASLLWCLGIAVVFGALALFAYRRL
ncbi:MAG TPA: ABC transporter permease [Ktedonobacterales bacterium]|nr:ABC transporter permease [Ktedonobacterales bacterium]